MKIASAKIPMKKIGNQNLLIASNPQEKKPRNTNEIPALRGDPSKHQSKDNVVVVGIEAIEEEKSLAIDQVSFSSKDQNS